MQNLGLASAVERLSSATHSAARSPGACGVLATRARLRAGKPGAVSPTSARTLHAVLPAEGFSGRDRHCCLGLIHSSRVFKHIHCCKQENIWTAMEVRHMHGCIILRTWLRLR